MGCALLYRADEIGWCELATPMAGVNIGLSEVESVGQGGGATTVFEVADIDAAKAHLDAAGVRQDGDIQHVPGERKSTRLNSSHQCAHRRTTFAANNN